MNNYYEYFEILETANKNEIILAYENKIAKYNNLKTLSDIQINELKLLRKGFYILSNDELREKYNKKLLKIPVPENHDEISSLDSVFNIDNSWMKTINIDDSKKKNGDINILGNRVFSLSDLNKPSYSTDSDIFLRKQQSCREEKNV
jgi:hypothetical protein